MGKHIVWIIITLAVLILIGCDDDRDIVSSSVCLNGSEYYPLNIGNYWRYDVEGLWQGTISITTTDTIRHDDGNLLYLYSRDDLIDTCSFKYYTNREGAIYYYTGASDISEDCYGTQFPTVKRNILRAELRNNDEWLTYDYPTSTPDTFKIFTGYKIVRGRDIFIDCILVRRCSLFAVDSLFYAKGVGLVRGIYGTRDGMRPTILNIDEYFVE